MPYIIFPDKEWIFWLSFTETNGSDIRIPKALLNSGEGEFIVIFIVMCGRKQFLLVRHLHVISGNISVL